MTARGKRDASGARRPWLMWKPRTRPEGPKYASGLRPFRAVVMLNMHQGRRARFASRLPLAVIFRACGTRIRYLAGAILLA